jgi:putative superfamily III holin-X
MGVQRIPIDPDVGIPDLVRRLGDDSKRLLSDEVRLAKLETHDSVRTGGKGAMWLAIALGVGVIAMAAFTLFVATLIGRVVSGHMWLGAIVAAVIDLAAGVVFVKKGLAAFREPSYSLAETRSTLH